MGARKSFHGRLLGVGNDETSSQPPPPPPHNRSSYHHPVPYVGLVFPLLIREAGKIPNVEPTPLLASNLITHQPPAVSPLPKKLSLHKGSTQSQMNPFLPHLWSYSVNCYISIYQFGNLREVPLNITENWRFLIVRIFQHNTNIMAIVPLNLCFCFTETTRTEMLVNWEQIKCVWKFSTFDGPNEMKSIH